ncbi:hypothetical protein PAMP_002411 [Pampus punctatissimus]
MERQGPEATLWPPDKHGVPSSWVILFVLHLGWGLYNAVQPADLSLALTAAATACQHQHGSVCSKENISDRGGSGTGFCCVMFGQSFDFRGNSETAAVENILIYVTCDNMSDEDRRQSDKAVRTASKMIGCDHSTQNDTKSLLTAQMFTTLAFNTPWLEVGQ